jgi:hypothetical protein
MSSVEDALSEALASRLDMRGIVTRWVCIVEVMEGETQMLHLVTISDDSTPYWTHRGMLDSAQLDDGVEDDDEDD